VVTVPYADPKPELDPMLRPVIEDELTSPKVMARENQAYIACRGWEWRRVHVLAWARWKGDDGASGWAVCLSWRLNHSTWWAFDKRMMHPL
jgi:hypothetical protein